MDDVTYINGIIRKRSDGRTRISIPYTSYDKLDKDTPVKLIVIKDTVQGVDTSHYSEEWKEKEQLALEYLKSHSDRYISVYELAYNLGITIDSTKKLMNRLHILENSVNIKRIGKEFNYRLN